MVGFWERRDVGKQAVSNENGSLVVQQDMLLEAPIKHIAAILAEIDLATEWAPFLSQGRVLHDFTGTAGGGLFQKAIQLVFDGPFWPFTGQHDAIVA